MLFSFSVSLLTFEKKQSECMPACLYWEMRRLGIFFLSPPFQIESDFAFIIKIM